MRVKVRIIVGINLYDLEKKINDFTKDYKSYAIDIDVRFITGVIWYDDESKIRKGRAKKTR